MTSEKLRETLVEKIFYLSAQPRAVCPYSHATRGDIDFVLEAEGV
jgi:organic hydroperoxide reductase OsmC/OhrA